MDKYKSATLAASAAVSASNGTVWAVLLTSGSTASSVVLQADGEDGSDAITIKAPASDSRFVCLEELGGKMYADIYATLSGTDATVTIWYD